MKISMTTAFAIQLENGYKVVHASYGSFTIVNEKHNYCTTYGTDEMIQVFRLTAEQCKEIESMFAKN